MLSVLRQKPYDFGLPSWAKQVREELHARSHDFKHRGIGLCIDTALCCRKVDQVWWHLSSSAGLGRVVGMLGPQIPFGLVWSKTSRKSVLKWPFIPKGFPDRNPNGLEWVQKIGKQWQTPEMQNSDSSCSLAKQPKYPKTNTLFKLTRVKSTKICKTASKGVGMIWIYKSIDKSIALLLDGIQAWKLSQPQLLIF